MHIDNYRDSQSESPPENCVGLAQISHEEDKYRVKKVPELLVSESSRATAPDTLNELRRISGGVAEQILLIKKIHILLSGERLKLRRNQPVL